jgi:hypothetical protein
MFIKGILGLDEYEVAYAPQTDLVLGDTRQKTRTCVGQEVVNQLLCNSIHSPASNSQSRVKSDSALVGPASV